MTEKEEQILRELQNYKGILMAKTRINAIVNPEIALHHISEAIDCIEHCHIQIDALKYDCTRYDEELSIARGEKQVFTDDDITLEKYKAIGTVEEFEALKGCNMPKKIQPKFLHNMSDTVSVWECDCGRRFKTTHEVGILDGTDIKYCSNCGNEFIWERE